MLVYCGRASLSFFVPFPAPRRAPASSEPHPRPASASDHGQAAQLRGGSRSDPRFQALLRRMNFPQQPYCEPPVVGLERHQPESPPGLPDPPLLDPHKQGLFSPRNQLSGGYPFGGDLEAQNLRQSHIPAGGHSTVESAPRAE